MSPAEQLRAAAAKIRTPLPPYYQGAAHVVVEESVFLAICQWEHTDTQACDSCELIEVHDEAMAQVLAALFNAREHLAAQLGSVAETLVFQRKSQREQAITFARAILGEAP